MRKKILVWLMALSMLLPIVSVNAAEFSDTAAPTQQEMEDSDEGETITTDSEEKALTEGEAVPSTEPNRDKVAKEEMPESQATSVPTETPEPEEIMPIPAQTPVAEAITDPTGTLELEEVLPTSEKKPMATATPTSTMAATPTSTATATPTAEVKTWTYKLSHAGIIQEAEFPDEDFVRADELENQVDLEEVKSFIAKSLLERKEEIDIFEYHIPVLHIDQVISEVLNENPQFFYVSFDECVVEETIVRMVIPIYERGRDEIVKASSEYEEAVAQALACIDNSMNAMEKAFVLHDYLVTHCEYDQSLTRYTAYDALVNGSAVCQGYTLAYADLMQRVGIQCENVPSKSMNHIWNMILIDGSWYHVDATWDDPVNCDSKSYCGHENFLASDGQMIKQEHRDWDATYNATNTRFDNAEWKDLKSIICKYQGNWYYMGAVGGINGLVQRTGSFENGTSSIVQKIPDVWYVWGSSNSYWPGLYGYIAIYDNVIYFNGRDSVYKYKNGQVKKCYTYTGGQGYLYDVTVINDRLYCGISRECYDDLVSYIEVIDPEVEVKPTAKPTATPTAQPTATPTPTPRRPVSSDFPFYDVDVVPGNWKYESVKFVYENGIMNGITNSDGTIDSFEPNEPLTRAMFATVLYRMAGQPSVAFENRFSDVSTGRYYSSAIIWAYKNGIVNGYADRSYGVDDYITREQIAKMLRVYAQVRGYSTNDRADISRFPDMSEVSGWAIEHMSWAVGCGMINGKNMGDTCYLAAKGNATRAECAAMLMRFINRYGK